MSRRSPTPRWQGARVGEATLLVRYQGNLSTLPVTVVNPKPGFAWKALPQHNYIDQAIDAKLQKLHIQPTAPRGRCGVPAACVARPDGAVAHARGGAGVPADAAKNKRAAKIDKLIASPAFVDHWTLKFGDLLQNSRKYLGEKGAFAFREWIRDAVAQNKPYDRMVREMLPRAAARTTRPRRNFYRVTRDAKPTMEKTTQVFLGRPHGLRAVPRPSLRALDAEPVLRDGRVLLARRPAARVRGRRGDRVRPAAGLRHEAPEGRPRGAAEVHRGRRGPAAGRDRRRAYAEWLTAKDNPFFAKSTVNRVWSYFFGKGIIDPVDDIRASNPPTNPALLDALTKDFVDAQFRSAASDADDRKLSRLPGRRRDQRVERGGWRQLLTFHPAAADGRAIDGRSRVGDRRAAGTSRSPPETRADQLTDPHIGKDGFLDVFGRPQRESSCECERRSDFSLPQALNLVNGKTISDAVADGNGRVAKAVLGGRSEKELVEELYLASFGRAPTAAELEKGLGYLKGGPRASRAQDLLWALLNSKGFLYNY